MATKITEIKVPFRDGKQQSWYDKYQVERGHVELVDNHVFSATLRYVGFSRGRSALNIEWLDTKTNKGYTSGMSLLDTALRGATMAKTGVTPIAGIFEIEGEFTFKKQGTAILLILYKQEF